MTAATIEWVGIVVPAHNEAAYLPPCLQALDVAIGQAAVATDVVVVLDACSDESLQAAAPFRTLSIEAHNVGAARRAGFAALLAARPNAIADDRCWLATTDADTLVPSDWLARMLAHAAEGWDAVAGTVRVTDWAQHWGPAAERLRERWLSGYDSTDHHRHVHGANLGFRADCYRAVGGMPAVALSEDASLVSAITASGGHVRHVADLPVLTSSRSSPRAAGGFGTTLEGLSA